MATLFGKISGVAIAAFLSIKSLQALSKRRRDVLFAKEELQESLQLVHAQVAFRHGARTPIFLPPYMENDLKLNETVVWDRNILLGDLSHTTVKYRVTTLDGGERPESNYDKRQRKIIWKGGTPAGVLTRVGQQQMFDLGRRLNQRYIKDTQFLQMIMDPNEIYIRTSNIERTILSARCVLAGLYGQQNINGEVTMVTKSEKDETIYPNLLSCPVLTHWAKFATRSDSIVRDEYNKSRSFVMEDLGFTSAKFSFIHLRDFMAAQEAHKMSISPVLSKHKDVIEKHALEELLSIHCGHPHGQHDILRLGVGKLLTDVVDRMKDKIHQHSSTQNKLSLYSVHDTTLVCLMLSLGLDVHKWVDFAADLALELYRNKNDEYFVKVLLQGKEQVLPGADSSICPFEKFLKITSSFSVDDWHKECHNTLQ